jgi:hypothetical protein
MQQQKPFTIQGRQKYLWDRTLKRLRLAGNPVHPEKVTSETNTSSDNGLQSVAERASFF